MLDLILTLVASPFIYVVVLGVCAGDAVFPVLPSESVVIALGVLSAAEGDISLPLLIAVAAVGAVIGDHTGYYLGYKAGPSVREKYLSGRKRDQLVNRLESGLNARGGSAILVARYVPGGRTATALLAGSVRFPLRRFTPFDLVAGITWALYGGLLGYWGGHTFDNTWVALGVAGVVAVVLFLLSEVARFMWLRRRQPGL